MKFHIIEPEVAGGWGKNTVVANSGTHPPEIRKLHYQFDGWLGDVILETFPCYIITLEAKRNLDAMGATGIEFDEVETSTSEEFNEMYPGKRLPEFVWLKVVGTAGHDDFGIAAPPSFRLVISERALNALKPLGIAHASLRWFSEQ